MTINDILATLPPEDMAAVMTAFEAGETFYVEYEPGRWVGVNTDASPQLLTEQSEGEFRAGTIPGRTREAVTPARPLRVRRAKSEGP